MQDKPDKAIDAVEEASEESFPASDPPSFEPGIAGTPDRTERKKPDRKRERE